MRVALLAFLVLSALTAGACATFVDQFARGAAVQLPRGLAHDGTRVLSLADKELLRGAMLTAERAVPRVGHHAARAGGITLDVALPDGSAISVYLVEYAISLDAEANAHHTRTFFLRSDDDAFLRGSATWTADNLYLSLHSPDIMDGEVILVEPLLHHDRLTSDAELYVSYSKAAYGRAAAVQKPTCGVHSADPAAEAEMRRTMARSAATPTTMEQAGSTKRTLRLAMAATAQYGEARTGLTAGVAGFVDGTQSELVIVLNRLNEVYLQDFALTYTFVANNKDLISTSTTDALSSDNADASSLINETPNWIFNTHGYSINDVDIGHCVSTGAGGLAGLGVACSSGSDKAAGVTGTNDPQGDPFIIDYVAHELGHQLGGDHTFNGNGGSCTPSTRAANAAVEPGSGVTIQAYAGICQSDNIASNSIAQFSWYSLAQMRTTIDRCTFSPTGNSGVVEITKISSGFTIPANTAFFLDMAAASKEDPDGVTYSWEDGDVGDQATLASGDVGNNPLFRPYLAVTSGRRYFAGGSGLGNIQPTSNGRSLYFRGTARDNAASGGRTVISTPVTITLDTSVGPLSVTAPSSGAEVAAGSQLSVSWSANGVDAIDNDACIFLVQSALDNVGVCVGEVAMSAGAASVAIPADVLAGSGSIVVHGAAATFYHSVDVTISGGGSGASGVGSCTAKCAPKAATGPVEGSSSPASALSPALVWRFVL